MADFICLCHIRFLLIFPTILVYIKFALLSPISFGRNTSLADNMAVLSFQHEWLMLYFTKHSRAVVHGQ